MKVNRVKFTAWIGIIMILMSASLSAIAESTRVFVLDNYKLNDYEGVYSLVDTNGNVIVPPGMYPSIRTVDGTNDLFAVENPDPESEVRDILRFESYSHPYAIMDKKHVRFINKP